MPKRKLKVKDLSFSFLPGWWNRNFGVKFGDSYYMDPEYRMKQSAEVKKLYAQNYGSLLVNEPDTREVPVKLDFGNATTGMYVGCEYEFPDDDAARNKHLEPEKLDSIKLPEKIDEVFPYKEIVSQTNYMNQKYNQNEMPSILPRGILNEAFLIEGDKILSDMYENPEEARRILDFSYDLLEKTVEYNAGIGYRGLVRVLNCMVELVSPDMYEEWLLPYDQKIFALSVKHGMTFGIHHCGHFIGKLIDQYRKIPKFAYLQIGFDSDLEKTIRMFPEAELFYIFDPVYCMNESKSNIAKKAENILCQAKDSAKDISVGVGAIDYGVPLENLQVIFDVLTE